MGGLFSSPMEQALMGKRVTMPKYGESAIMGKEKEDGEKAELAGVPPRTSPAEVRRRAAERRHKRMQLDDDPLGGPGGSI